MSSQVTYCKDLSLYRDRQGFIGENSWRHGWWTGPFIVYTREIVGDKTFSGESTNLCESIVVIDPSQLHHFSMCQAMPTGLYTRRDIDSESYKFKPRKNKTRSSENMVMSYFQRVRPQCRVKSFYSTVHRKTFLHAVLMAFVDTATLGLKPNDAIIINALV